MNPVSFNFTLGLLGAIMAVPMLVLGIVFIKMGHWPKRRGSEPHCRKCDYLLVGIASERCPECGSDVGPEINLRGSRSRNWGITLTGFAFNLLGLMSFVPGSVHLYRTVNWYHYRPTFLVMKDMDSAHLPVSGRALRELSERNRYAGLSTEYRARIVDRALKEHRAPKPSPLLRQLLDFAGYEFHAGRLDANQSDQLLRECFRVRLAVLPFPANGPFILLSCTYDALMPGGWHGDIGIYAVTVDGERNSRELNRWLYDGNTPGTGRVAVNATGVGPHSITVEWSAVIRRGNQRSDFIPSPNVIRKVYGQASLQFEVPAMPAISTTTPLD